MNTDLDTLADLDRIRALAEYDLFDTGLARELEEVCRRTADRLDMPLCAVQAVLDTATATLATNGGEGDFLSAVGGSPNEFSFCPRVVVTGEPYVQDDLSRSEQWVASPAVRAGLVRAYAGVPVTLPDGTIVGSHCVMGPEAHEFTDDDLAELTVAADEVAEVLGRHRL